MEKYMKGNLEVAQETDMEYSLVKMVKLSMKVFGKKGKLKIKNFRKIC